MVFEPGTLGQQPYNISDASKSNFYVYTVQIPVGSLHGIVGT